MFKDVSKEPSTHFICMTQKGQNKSSTFIEWTWKSFLEIRILDLLG